MDFLQKITAGTKAAAVATACLLIVGCTFGDPSYSSSIFVVFPGKSIEDVKSAVIALGTRRGYRKGGFLLVDGKQDFEFCAQTFTDKACFSDDNECRVLRNECMNEFRKRARWVEVETRGANSLSFWFDVIRDGSVVAEPRVMIRQGGAGCIVTFTLWEPSVELTGDEKNEYYALKAFLIDQYGSAVTAENEPSSGRL